MKFEKRTGIYRTAATTLLCIVSALLVCLAGGVTMTAKATEAARVTVNMHTFHDDTAQNRIGFCIVFSEDVCDANVVGTDVASAKWAQTMFSLNGKTFGEIRDYAVKNGKKFEVRLEYANQLTVWIDKSLEEENGGLKHKDGAVSKAGNVVVCRSGARFPNGLLPAYEEAIFDSGEDGSWMMRRSFPEVAEWAPVGVASIANPDRTDNDGKVRYEVTFDAEVATKRYIHINGGATWLRGAAGAIGLEPEEVERLAYYGILDSILDKIEIGVDGVTRTVRQWQEADKNPDNFAQGVLQIHYNQQNGLDTLQILWASKRIPEGSTTAQATEDQPLQPAIDAAISITFKAGFRTPAYQEIKKDVTFTYGGKSGDVFVRKGEGTTADSVTFEKVFYNGEKIEAGSTITLPAGAMRMDAALFTVDFAEGKIPFTVIGNTDMKVGANTVTITATAGGKTETFTFIAVCSEKQTEEGSGKKGCGSAAAASALPAAAVLLALVGSVAFARKQRGLRK